MQQSSRLAKANAAKAVLQQSLTKLAGYPVEIVVRGERSFTFVFEAVDRAAGERLVPCVKGAKTSIEADAETGCTYVYVDA